MDHLGSHSNDQVVLTYAQACCRAEGEPPGILFSTLWADRRSDPRILVARPRRTPSWDPFIRWPAWRAAAYWVRLWGWTDSEGVGRHGDRDGRLGLSACWSPWLRAAGGSARPTSCHSGERAGVRQQRGLLTAEETGAAGAAICKAGRGILGRFWATAAEVTSITGIVCAKSQHISPLEALLLEDTRRRGSPIRGG